MVDIPEVKREYNQTPNIQAQTNLTVPQVDNSAMEQVSKSLGQGVDYFQKQMEVASKDEATKASNAYRDTFNTIFNVGEGDQLGLKNIEGYDSFKSARQQAEEKLLKKRDELVNREGLSDYAKEIIKSKLDDSSSTFKYYMDSQEGQVKTLDATRNHQVQRQTQTEDTSALFGLYNGTPQANKLLQNQIKKLEDSDKEFYFGRGLATREEVTDENGKKSFVYKLSPPAQFEMQKNVSQTIASSILGLAADNTNAAKAAMQEFGKYIIPDTQVKIEKTLNEKLKDETAYGLAFRSINKPEEIKAIQEAYTKKNDMAGLKEFNSQVSSLRTQLAKSEKDASADALKLVREKFYSMPPEEMAKYGSVIEARKNKEFLEAYSIMTPTDQDKFTRMFNGNQTLSLDALAQVQQDLMAGNVPRETFVEHVNQLPEKYRKQAYDAYLGFNINGYKGNASRDAMSNWREIERIAKKDGGDDIFDITDAESYADAYNTWMDKISSSKEVYDVGSDQANRQRQEFIDEMRKKNQSWFGGLFGGNKQKTTLPSYDQKNIPIKNMPAPLSEAEQKKYLLLRQKGVPVQKALQQIILDRKP
jgi:hypothetical protein